MRDGIIQEKKEIGIRNIRIIRAINTKTLNIINITK